MPVVMFSKGETNQSNIRESFLLANIRTFFPIRIFGQGTYYYYAQSGQLRRARRPHDA